MTNIFVDVKIRIEQQRLTHVIHTHNDTCHSYIIIHVTHIINFIYLIYYNIVYRMPIGLYMLLLLLLFVFGGVLSSVQELS